MKAAIVTKDESIREDIKCRWATYGSLELFTSAEEVVEALSEAHVAEDPYRILFLEVEVEGVDVSELVLAIKQLEDSNKLKHSNRIRIIILAKESPFEEVMKTFKLGCHAYLLIPDDLKRFDEMISKIVEALSIVRKPTGS